GLEYYLRFINRFPSVFDLAKAEEQEVLRLWQGLGYYSRARNLHKTAQSLVEIYGGSFPADYNSLLKLQGIGPYTAAAIASFAFNLPYAVVDGNVNRLLSRYFGISEPIDTSKGQKLFQTLAQEMLDLKNPGIHNQAMMEFGSLQCKPQNPDCTCCPLNTSCQAFGQNRVTDFPFKQGKTKVRNRYFNYLVILNKAKSIALKKRIEKDVWMNLYDFPLIETDKAPDIEMLIQSETFKNLIENKEFTLISSTNERIHLLSHQRLHIRFFLLQINESFTNNSLGFFTSLQIEELPLPKPIEQFIATYDFA
ncbi:MAG: A/G-specific adenine glycosylase, partial [Bacteroidales bacterium]|nr:A/G-specific adenine glycosylase [Bacteroidales bacterium]